ncbi:WD repeat-containing protein 74 [Neosynchiropus ocellatus]
MGDSSRLCSVWLGSETGIVKGVSLTRKRAFNFCNTSQLSRDQEVRVLAWGDSSESELLVGAVDGTVKTFSTEKGVFTDARNCGDPAEGHFVGLAPVGSALVTCNETGSVRVWKEGDRPAAQLDAGNSVCRMRLDLGHPNRIATGGKENGLKVWDLERPEKPVFSAKNLRDDWLDLRRPHWVRDLAFIPNSERLVTCTGHHQVHVFDPSTPQRRPVLEAEFGEFPLTALSLAAAGNAVVVGNTHGQIAVLDLRKGLVRGVLKGLSGGVRDLQCHPHRPLVASCGLDRFLRIHSLEDRKVQHKVYLKSRLNCVLLASQHPDGAEGTEVGVQEVKEEDEVWDSMERVEEAIEEEEVGDRRESTKRKLSHGEEEVLKRKPKEELKKTKRVT